MFTIQDISDLEVRMIARHNFPPGPIRQAFIEGAGFMRATILSVKQDRAKYLAKRFVQDAQGQLFERTSEFMVDHKGDCRVIETYEPCTTEHIVDAYGPDVLAAVPKLPAPKA